LSPLASHATIAELPASSRGELTIGEFHALVGENGTYSLLEDTVVVVVGAVVVVVVDGGAVVVVVDGGAVVVVVDSDVESDVRRGLRRASVVRMPLCSDAVEASATALVDAAPRNGASPKVNTPPSPATSQ
jgi:hypothetical protein